MKNLATGLIKTTIVTSLHGEAGSEFFVEVLVYTPLFELEAEVELDNIAVEVYNPESKADRRNGIYNFEMDDNYFCN
jgi:hypothetical protein